MFKKRTTADKSGGTEKSGDSRQRMLDYDDMKRLPSIVYHSQNSSKVGECMEMELGRSPVHSVAYLS